MSKPYPNLEAEMARHGIKRSQIAELLDVRRGTISDKMNGKSRFDIDEAFAIKKTFFKDCPMDYLFDREATVVA